MAALQLKAALLILGIAAGRKLRRTETVTEILKLIFQNIKT